MLTGNWGTGSVFAPFFVTVTPFSCPPPLLSAHGRMSLQQRSCNEPEYIHCQKVVASAEELVFALTMLPLVLMVGLGIFRVDWVAVATPPASSDVDWKLFIQIMFWTSTYWQKVRHL